jgi:hypothetical protein
VGAVFAVQMLAETPLDNRLGLGRAKPCGIRFESEAAVDDCGVETDAGGWLFIQAKTGVTLSAKAESDLRKTAGQIVRLWHGASKGRGKKGWDRPLDLSKDRVAIAAGPNSSGSVTRNLARALNTCRAKYTAPLPKAQKVALATLIKALKTVWKALTGQTAGDSDIRAILPFIVVMPFDMADADRAAAVAGAGHLVSPVKAAATAFVAIEKHCQSLMEDRLGGDAGQFRAALSALGIALKAPPSYEADVAGLLRYSDATRRRLAEFEKTAVSGVDITITREVPRASSRPPSAARSWLSASQGRVKARSSAPPRRGSGKRNTKSSNLRSTNCRSRRRRACALSSDSSIGSSTFWTTGRARRPRFCSSTHSTPPVAARASAFFAP